MHNIRILMCCHKQYDIVPPLCEPIQCGAALNPRLENVLYDSYGENISALNREYCELTAHYFAWKNVVSDYYGFCHYRRFFCAEGITSRPYLCRGGISSQEAEKLLPDEECWRKLTAEYPIIVPKSENMGLPAGEHYRTSKYHYEEDLELFLKILGEKAPQLINAAEHYLSQNRQYFCNMFVMSREYFFEYCEILFSVLGEFDRRKKLHGDFQSDRTCGYLGEIFTGVYISFCRSKKVKIKELPRLDTQCTVKKRLAYQVFPPESKRRFAAKRLAKSIGGKQGV
ncbi:MAG: DUF4422 domain-containing protein [Oscillospiraceae bacterium]